MDKTWTLDTTGTNDTKQAVILELAQIADGEKLFTMNDNDKKQALVAAVQILDHMGSGQAHQQQEPPQQAPGLPDRGVVAHGETQDHVVDVGLSGGRDDAFGINFAEAADIVGDSAIEEFYVLRHETDVRA